MGHRVLRAARPFVEVLLQETEQCRAVNLPRNTHVVAARVVPSADVLELLCESKDWDGGTEDWDAPVYTPLYRRLDAVATCRQMLGMMSSLFNDAQMALKLPSGLSVREQMCRWDEVLRIGNADTHAGTVRRNGGSPP